MIVYLDVFLIENTILNLIIFISVSIVLKYKINFFRLLTVSFIGSIYTFIEYYLFNNINIFVKVLIKIFISILLVDIGFNNIKNIKRKIKIWLMFIIITIIYGGFSFLIQNMFCFDEYILLREEGNKIGVFPIKTVSISFSVCFILIFIISKFYNNKINIDDFQCDIEIEIFRKK